MALKSLCILKKRTFSFGLLYSENVRETGDTENLHELKRKKRAVRKWTKKKRHSIMGTGAVNSVIFSDKIKWGGILKSQVSSSL